MARDPRKNSAFDSGMRGREKPKVQGNEKTMPGGRIGDSTGVDLSAYASGMRGIEQPKQKPASGGANYGQGAEGSSGGENRQAPNTRVGNPDGHNDAQTGKRHGVDEGGMRQSGSNAKQLGIPGNNTEAASQSASPYGDGDADDAAGILGEEDDTHINLRIPKASLKKKQAGVHGS